MNPTWQDQINLGEFSYSKFYQLKIKKPTAQPITPKMPVEAPKELTGLTQSEKILPMMPEIKKNHTIFLEVRKISK